MIARPVTEVASETPLAALLLPLTPADAFYVRHHAREVPRLAAGEYALELAGARGTTVLRAADLRALPRVSETVTLTCAGNGRRAFDPTPPGVPWGFGAISTARWDGVRLRDVLAVAGVPPGAAHVVTDGYDGRVDAEKPPYRRSLPLARALSDAAFVADAMNGEPIPPEHGGPVRLIVAGWTANHSMKWLRRIAFSDRPDDSFWTAVDYRVPDDSAPIEAPPPLAILASPARGAAVGRSATLHGVAFGFPAAHGVRVEVDGRFAGDAVLTYDDGPYAWGRWSLDVALEPGRRRIAVRSTDSSGAPVTPAPAWNPKGYCYDGPHEVDVEVR